MNTKVFDSEKISSLVARSVAKTVKNIIELNPQEDRQAVGEAIAKYFETDFYKIVEPQYPTSPEQSFADEMAGISFSTEEKLMINTKSLLDSFAKKAELLKETVGVQQVQEMFGYQARQSVIDRINKQTLLGVKHCGKWRIPQWQFDASQEYGVVDGLVNTIKVLDIDNLAKVSWFTIPNSHFEGLTPIEMLRLGRKREVIAEAKGVGISQ